jgi:hypothetical protein
MKILKNLNIVRDFDNTVLLLIIKLNNIVLLTVIRL